jgi:hypothetical protein
MEVFTEAPVISCNEEYFVVKYRYRNRIRVDGEYISKDLIVAQEKLLRKLPAEEIHHFQAAN